MQKQAFSRTNHAPTVGAQFKAFAALFAFRIHQMSQIQLGFVVFRGQFDVFFALVILHAQFVFAPRADDVARMPLIINVVFVVAVVKNVRDVWPIGVAVCKTQRDFHRTVQWKMDAVMAACVRLSKANRAALATGIPRVEIKRQLHSIAANFVYRRVIRLFCGRRADFGRQSASDFWAAQQGRPPHAIGRNDFKIIDIAFLAAGGVVGVDDQPTVGASIAEWPLRRKTSPGRVNITSPRPLA